MLSKAPSSSLEWERVFKCLGRGTQEHLSKTSPRSSELPKRECFRTRKHRKGKTVMFYVP